MQPHVLTRLDTHPIPVAPGEVRVFNFVFNEVDRLPYFLDYYRKAGVSRFFIIDNNSTDGTQQYLLSQPDCHVFHTANSFREANCGIAWTKTLLDMYGTGQWCLLVDADELLVYPECESIKLPDFCKSIEAEGNEALLTFLMDMYSNTDMKDAVCKPGTPFTDICPFFDKDYTWVPRFGLRHTPFPPLEVLGGPRERNFYPDQGKNSYLRRLYIHLLMRGNYLLRKKLRLPVPASRAKAPALFKVPLIRWNKSYAYTASTHEIHPVKLARSTGVLLHFKFFADFHARAEHAVAAKNHAGDSAEYRQYLEGLSRIKGGCFMYAGSQRYQNSQQLLELGLIKKG